MKKNNAIAKKYAKLLFLDAKNENQTDKVKKILDITESVLKEEIMDFFSNPLVDEGTKFELIKNAFPVMPEIMYGFFSVLIKKNEMNMLPEVTEKYRKLVMDFQNIVEAKVISAEKIDESALSKIRKTLEKFTGRNIMLEESLDISLVGGVKIETDNLIIDGTIRGKIEKVRLELME